MVEVIVSLIILSVRIHEGSMFSLWFLVGGFIQSRLVGCSHTVIVTMPSLICCYGVVRFDFDPPCVTAYCFTWVWARLYYWCMCSCL
jgi:hypothetical protein